MNTFRSWLSAPFLIVAIGLGFTAKMFDYLYEVATEVAMWVEGEE